MRPLFELCGERTSIGSCGIRGADPATTALHERFGFKVVGRVFGRMGGIWKVLDVCWTERRVIVLLMGCRERARLPWAPCSASHLGWELRMRMISSRRRMSRRCGMGFRLRMRIASPGWESLRSLIAAWMAAGKSAVLACSALKQEYRDR